MVYNRKVEYNIEHLLSIIFSHHQVTNSIEMDGKICCFCDGYIPLVKKRVTCARSHNSFIKVDRSNRVDFQLTCGDRRMVTSHIKCWFRAIFTRALQGIDKQDNILIEY